MNGDGQASFSSVANDREGASGGGKVLFDEPGLAPSYKEIERVAQETGKEVLTREDFPQGLFLVRTGAEGMGSSSSSNDTKPLREEATSMEYFLASREPWDPGVSYAIDVKAGEFLLYK